MDQNAWTMFFVGIALACAVIALGVVLYPKLRFEKQGYPFEAQIEAALLPIVFEGICSAFRLSEKSMDDLQKRIRGADKQKIAISIYEKLPGKIGPFDLVVVKKLVTQQQFEKLVQDTFENFDQFFTERQSHFDELFEKWKTENTTATLK